MTGPQQQEQLPSNRLDYVDAHFQANKVEYEAIVRSAGIRQGWHVLDAGCGGGGFIPWIADLVGPSGKVDAIDISPGSIEAVGQRLAEWNLACEVNTKVGSFTEIPYPDNSFDASWCSNAIDAHTEDDLLKIIREFQRVVKPGGIVAIKNYDSGLCRWYPPEPFARWHLLERRVKSDDSRSIFARTLLINSGNLRRYMRSVGLKDVWQKSFLIERWAPLPPADRQYIEAIMTGSAKGALEYDLPEEDLELWRKMADPDSPENPINDPEFYWCEANTLAVGRVV